MGYLSISPEGSIARANLTAASMLGWERRELVGMSMYQVVARQHAPMLQRLRQRLIAAAVTESAELLLQRNGGEPFWARLDIVTRHDPALDIVLWQVAFSNTDAEKRAELMLAHVNEELEAQVERRTEQLTWANKHLLGEIDLRKQAEEELRRARTGLNSG